KNRDLVVDGGDYVCGYNSAGVDDDTLFTARIQNEENLTIAVIVNYACHPTTLAWENDQLSPDYIGTLRETIRKETNAPLIFLQGCSGDLGPALGFTGDVSVPERHGRQVAYASLATIENMGTPATKLVLEEVKKSGADLAAWREQASAPDTTLATNEAVLDWKVRDGLQKSAELNELLKDNPDNAEKERLKRKLCVRTIVGEEDTTPFPCWFARMGNILFVSYPGEAYSKIQRDLRDRYPDYTIICVNVCSTWIGYVIPEEDYQNQNLYPAWQTPLAPGIFEAVYELSIQELDKLTGN
ncbi:MAG: alkaline ceramidase, partial [Lentisphaeria bacterium]|nr:alkaline ceramidase [Lentisphaeria bacterium]